MEGEIYKVIKKSLSSLKKLQRRIQNRKLTENYNGRENYNEREFYQENLHHRYITLKYSFMTRTCSYHVETILLK